MGKEVARRLARLEQVHGDPWAELRDAYDRVHERLPGFLAKVAAYPPAVDPDSEAMQERMEEFRRLAREKYRRQA